VKTLKCDYAQVNPKPGAITLLQLLPACFEDYWTCFGGVEGCW
jgi:hypothetical protein